LKGVDFFGVEVELWKIADSNLAPKFNVVSKPNEWSKSMRATRDADQSERTAILSSLWTSFIDYIRQNAPVLNPPKPTGMPWIRFEFGDIRCVVSYAPSKHQVSYYLLFRGSNPIQLFKLISGDSDKLEEEVQLNFEWKQEDDGSGHAVTYFDFNHENSKEYEKSFIPLTQALSQLKKALESRQSIS
jgi:hypothetical protein